jgi:hypothetical protein
MLAPVRLATIHPLTAHLTIGGLPLTLVAYAISARRRSTEWALVGDAALVLTAAATLVTLTFGLVSDAVVPWPGGLERWRILHLTAGIAATVALAVLAALRLRGWGRRSAASRGLFVAVLAIAGLAGFTGWIGGEVLVFHSGMAVRAAGEGVLAPPTDAHAPGGFLDAMRGVRASWGAITARLAWMVVQRPRAEDFAQIERYAQRMRQLAEYMADHPPARARDTVASMSMVLAGDAIEIADAARDKKLEDLTKALGETSGHCASCHQQARWR